MYICNVPNIITIYCIHNPFGQTRFVDVKKMLTLKLIKRCATQGTKTDKKVCNLGGKIVFYCKKWLKKLKQGQIGNFNKLTSLIYLADFRNARQIRSLKGSFLEGLKDSSGRAASISTKIILRN